MEYCGHCGSYHQGVCPRIKSIDRRPDGSVKTEYHAYDDAALATERAMSDRLLEALRMYLEWVPLRSEAEKAVNAIIAEVEATRKEKPE